MVKKLALATVLALATAGSAWAASWAGQQLDYRYSVGTLSSGPYGRSDSGTITVGAGVEVADVADESAFMDISDGRIAIHFLRDSRYGTSENGVQLQFNGWVLSDLLGTVPAFTAVSMDTAATTLTDLSAVHLSFNADAITVDWKGLSFRPGEELVFSVQTAVVPEPASLPLMLAGLLGIALVHRLRA